ncbi:MAG: chemotaxis protein CheB [Gammaproteobacteria bacterium]
MAKKKAGDKPASTAKGPARKAGSESRDEHRTNAAPESLFPVVGVGASAGGLEAFTQLLRALPVDTGMAFVLVQHLHPGYESALTEILGRESRMPVAEVRDQMVVEPNHIYVIPPSAALVLMHSKLHLLPRKEHEKSMPIDQFLRSLAADRGGRAIGVILSGTASDGVLGLKAIKAEGGITFAQDEASAKYDGMPHSAISAGVVDFVLPPAKIADELARLARHPYVSPKKPGKSMPQVTVPVSALERIFMLLRMHTGHDFSYYKRSTIERRITRRMLLHKLENLNSYVRYLEEHSPEIQELFHDMLINVTGFFRDQEAFDALAEKAFPALSERPEGSIIRIWVPGCSTGEEAYSIAIALLEHLGDKASTVPIQLFATDIDELAIDKARVGIYPENIVQDVNPDRLRRFFSKVESGYQISKRVREMCIFATQDVTKDPPFSRMDLISCRNLLIYLGPVLQKRVLRIFHYALKPNGFLFLGTAESIGGMADLFHAVEGKEKVYMKKAVATPHEQFGVPVEVPAVAIDDVKGGKPVRPAVDLEREVDRLLMAEYVPAGVVVNTHMDILHFRGRTGIYLEPAPGEASFNLTKMARDGLALELNAAVREAIQTRATSRRTGISFQDGGKTRFVNVEVTPIIDSRLPEPYFLVVFQDVAVPVAKPEAEKRPKDAEVKRLQDELAATKEYLQSVIEQQETTNEELRSANEEIQSSNEELQSINEELETAKEELQSTNEELATVNDELQSRAHQLERANNDLTNLVTSADIPIVIVGPDLRIRRFTAQAEKLLNLIGTDVGRPLSDINPNIHIPNFKETVIGVIDSVKPVQCEIADSHGHWYSIRIRPYKTADNRIDGAVIAFIDVDQLKRALDDSRHAKEYAEAMIAAVRHPLLVLDKDLRVVSASKAYMSTFQATERETIGNLVHRLGNGQWAIPDLRAKLEETARDGPEFNDFLVTHEFPKIGERTVRVSGRQIQSTLETGPMVLMQIEDVTGGERVP